jgi:predicted NBD/HSP70 family sugar kinase
LGVDLGGTKIECAVIDVGDTVIRRRIATEADKGYEHIISLIKRLIAEVAGEIAERPAPVEFATPGVLDPETQRMKNFNTVVMNGQPMQKDIETALQIPVMLANDANCFALAETLLGVGKDYPNADLVFGVINDPILLSYSKSSLKTKIE